MSFADPQFLCHQKFLGSQYLAFLDVPNDLLKSFDSDNYVKVAKFESTRNPNNFDLLFKKSSKITSKSPIGYPSFERTSLQILNKDFSLFVIKSDKITIKIKDLPNSNSIRTSKLKLGVSTLYDSTIRIKRDDIILTFFTSTGKVTIIDLPVKLGDELLLTSIPKNFQRDNVTYISSPYLEGCYRK
jgi:hypothetical protein